jgi:ring-1,2-phenylacetyl-CoA epoxidase subunit PaaC
VVNEINKSKIKMNQSTINYTLQIADNSLILGHRLSEWCGHGPVLEQDIALTNIALDLIGQARTLYQYTASIEGNGKTEDDYPYLRDVRQFKNVLLVEQPNTDFAYTMVRQFFFDTFNYFFLKELRETKNETFKAYAEKSLKEVSYHLRFSSEWIVRLGDGTQESHDKMQLALNDLWSYRNECVISNDLDKTMYAEGAGVDLDVVKVKMDKKIEEIINLATLEKPEDGWNHKGGKEGIHTEYLGFILSELQYMQRAYPGSEW